MDTEIELSHPAVAVTATDDPERKWAAWGVWSGFSLALTLFAVLALGIDSGLLLGWAVGVIVAAMLTVFGRQ